MKAVEVTNADMWRVYELAHSKVLPRKLTAVLSYALVGMVYWEVWD